MYMHINVVFVVVVLIDWLICCALYATTTICMDDKCRVWFATRRICLFVFIRAGLITCIVYVPT